MTKPKQSQTRIRIDGREVDLNELRGNVVIHRNRGGGCAVVLLILIIFGVTAGGIVVLMSAITPNFDITAVLRGDFSFGMGPQQRELASPATFDPIASYAEALEFAGEGAQLIEMSAYYVRSDGTMDLTASYSPSPYTEYTFAREVPPPDNAPPVGVAGNTGSTFYEQVEIIAERPGQGRRVTEFSGNARLEYTYVTQGLRRDTDTPTSTARTFIDAPTCSFADFWAEAIRRDAPRDAVAIIEYDADGYQFRISTTPPIRLEFDQDCRLVR